MTLRRNRTPAWRRLSWPELRAFAAALLLLPIVAASLRLLGARRTIAWTAPKKPCADRVDVAARVATAITAMQRAQRYGLIEGTCLSRSLALRVMLARAGVETELRFGGRRSEGRFEAHAWLERHGTPIGDTPDIGLTFVPFTTPGRTGSTSRTPARPSSS